MPHDGHVHHHPHTHAPSHPPGHNQAPAEHLHSHPHAHPHAAAPGRASEDDQLVIDALIEGFAAAEDKASFLRLARVPLSLRSATGGNDLHLVDVELTHGYQVGTASPGFASAELVYHPYPGKLIRERTELSFVYVSLTERRDVPLAEMVRMIEDSALT